MLAQEPHNLVLTTPHVSTPELITDSFAVEYNFHLETVAVELVIILMEIKIVFKLFFFEEKEEKSIIDSAIDIYFCNFSRVGCECPHFARKSVMPNWIFSFLIK